MIKPRLVPVFFVLFAAPQPSLAHSPIEGIDSLYSGFLHPLFVPAHLLLLIALGAFIGQKGPQEHLAALAAFGSATIVGLIAAGFIDSEIKLIEAFLLSGAAIVGLLIASDLTVWPILCSLIAAAAGFLLGLDSPQESLSGKEKIAALFGNGLSIYLLLLYPMALVEHFSNKDWQKIGVRILGSWVSASSLLVVALTVSSI